ncbi:MAG TPA: galactokinase family protein [Anaerolineales bacterium]|nr:galactokinase family protein [Anaerolineales bacterium]
MAKLSSIQENIRSGKSDALLARLYGKKPASLDVQRRRYGRLLDLFASTFPAAGAIEMFSTPGRTEVGGNHTDHNAGRILAAAVNLDVLAVAARNETGIITIQSEGYPQAAIDTRQLEVVEAEKYTSAALIRGVCARMQQLGFRVGGFEACVTSDVLKGSGISSSAAFEVLVCTILDHLYNDGNLDPILNAQVSQYAENEYFDKPCGLMDQTTCAVGGFVTIDFKDFAHPLVRKIDFDFAASGYSMVIVDTGGNHADLTEDYAALEHEMKSVAHALGGRVLREFSRQKVLDETAFLRSQVNDRAILRALHFYADNQRVADQVTALETNDFPRFLDLIVESGQSSWMLNQNCYSPRNVGEQGIPIALEVSKSVLAGRGAWRVHGGGFAGTIQAFVPGDLLGTYLSRLGSIFGEKACHEMIIRPVGTTKLDIL